MFEYRLLPISLKQSLIVCSLLMLFIFTPIALARDVRQGRTCEVAADEIITGNLFVLCEDLIINGTVEGSIFGAAMRAEMNGTVEGSLYMASTNLTITGIILGDVNFGGVSLNWRTPLDVSTDLPDTQPIPTPIRTNNLMALGLSVIVEEDAVLPGSIVNLGYQLIVNGAVRDEINFWGSTLQIGGAVTGDVYAHVGDPAGGNSSVETLLLPFNFDVSLADPGLTITESGRVVGSLYYESPAAAVLEGDVVGDVAYIAPLDIALPSLEEPATFSRYAQNVFTEATSLLVVGALLVLLSPVGVNIPMQRIRHRPFASLSVGLLSFIVSFPIVLIMISLSLLIVVILLLVGLDGVAMVVGVALSVLNIGGVTIFYFVAIYVARALFSLAIGRFIARSVWARDGLHINTYIALIIGIIVLSILVTLPMIGWVFNALSLFFGLGALLTLLLERFRNLRGGDPETPVAQYPVSSAVARPHPLPKHPEAQPDPTIESPKQPIYRLPGEADLPAGFDMAFFDED